MTNLGLLKRHFKKIKFDFNVKENSYESEEYIIIWNEDSGPEEYVLQTKVNDLDTGANYFEDEFQGSFMECIKEIKKMEDKTKCYLCEKEKQK